MTRSSAESLDDPTRVTELRQRIRRKPALRMFYLEVYAKYAAVIARCPGEGLVVELGTGGGFSKEVIPEIVTSDTISYDGIDRVVDATQMPFAKCSVRAILMMNVFHHIPDVAAFLKEAARVLIPGGRLFMVDQHPGWIARPILKWVHHEGFDDRVAAWKFQSSGPLSGANGALAWIVFQRDRAQFERQFPELRVLRYEPHTPLRYWLSGGLKAWSLLPGWTVSSATKLDAFLMRLTPQLGSFVDIEIEKR